MANMFSGYQHISKYVAYIYTTEQVYKDFLTKKLLGAKRIRIKGVPTDQATHVIDLKQHGAVEAKVFYEHLDGTQQIIIKLK